MADITLHCAMDEKLTETYLSGETIFDGKVVHLEKWEVRLPNGKTAPREVVKHLGAAAVVAVDDEENVILVRQHRVSVGELMWEIPAGKLDSAGEDPFLCAKRELEEETGLRAENWQWLTTIITTPGYCTEKIALYLATGLSEHEMHLDADEFLTSTKIPLKQAIKMAMAGEFKDAKTALALLMAEKVLQQK